MSNPSPEPLTEQGPQSTYGMAWQEAARRVEQAQHAVKCVEEDLADLAERCKRTEVILDEQRQRLAAAEYMMRLVNGAVRDV